MSLTFTKLFSSITDSSIWSESDQTRLVWITLLSMADQFGRVHAAIPGLANRSRVSIEETEKALKKFLSPDPYSRTKDHDGKRIEEIDGGWRLLNHALYREIIHAEDRKEQIRQAQSRYRTKKRNQAVIKSDQKSSESSQAEANTESESKKEEKSSTTPKTKRLADEVFLEELRKLHGVGVVDSEIVKMKSWLLTEKGLGRSMTRSFVVRWLNRREKPLIVNSKPKPDYKNGTGMFAEPQEAK